MMNWEEDKDLIFQKYYDNIDGLIKNLYSTLDSETDKSKRLYPIIQFINDRVSTVWFLTTQQLLWDADIIDRSVLESLIKLIFIVNAPSETERENRFNEYYNDLWEVSLIRQSEISKKHLPHFQDELSKLAHKPLILNPEQEQYLKNKWNRKDQKKLMQKWSFSEMVFSLIKSYKGGTMDVMTGLLHEYRMCSHVAHGDETGIGIIQERLSRDYQDQENIIIGHILKKLSNCQAYISILCLTITDYLKKDNDFVKRYSTLPSEIEVLIKKYQYKVFEGSEYDGYREE